MKHPWPKRIKILDFGFNLETPCTFHPDMLRYRVNYRAGPYTFHLDTFNYRVNYRAGPDTYNYRVNKEMIIF